MTLAVAIDLGTTHIKGALLGAGERLEEIISRPAPAMRGTGLIRESDAEEYFRIAEEIYREFSNRVAPDTPLGIAAQRSSFVLFERETGTAATPFISWQDRRADEFCRRLSGVADRVTDRTGLMLSPHYAAPKLASLFEMSRDLRDRCSNGELLFGTADVYFLSRLTNRRAHETDLSIAARTLLADHRAGQWSDDMIELFGIPRRILPVIRPTSGRSVPLDGGCRLTASVSDQAACSLAVISRKAEDVLINLGTGAFVLLPANEDTPARARYLSAPLHRDSGGAITRSIEGTVNGAGSAAAMFSTDPIAISDSDTMPENFCAPDSAGIGSPHWLPDKGFLFSRGEAEMTPLEKRRIVLEGIVFRIREILDDLRGHRRRGRLFVSGGLAREEFMPAGLASCLGESVFVLDEPEATLLGAARLAAGLSPRAGLKAKEVRPVDSMAYFRSKYHSWRDWYRRILSRP